MIDLHTHILPALDDGAKDLDQAVDMARMAAADGITKMVATPHVFKGQHGLQKLEVIKKKKDELALALDKNKIAMDLYTGAEARISHSLIKEIQKNKKHIVINQSSYMFVEFPSDHVFSEVKQIFFDIMTEGINIIIAHPERNTVFRQKPSLLYDLLLMGSYCQANGGSFTGVYGQSAQETVLRFLRWNFIHCVASDCHNTRSIPPLLSEAAKKVEEESGSKAARALYYKNPQAVLDDKALPFQPEPVDPSEKKRSLKIKLPKIFG